MCWWGLQECRWKERELSSQKNSQWKFQTCKVVNSHQPCCMGRLNTLLWEMSTGSQAICFYGLCWLKHVSNMELRFISQIVLLAKGLFCCWGNKDLKDTTFLTLDLDYLDFLYTTLDKSSVPVVLFSLQFKKNILMTILPWYVPNWEGLMMTESLPNRKDSVL